MKAHDGRLSVNPCPYDDNVDENDDAYAYKDETPRQWCFNIGTDARTQCKGGVG